MSNKVNPPQLAHLPTRAAIHIATAYYWCESGTHPLSCVPIRGLRKEWISISPPPPKGNCLGSAHAFSLCSARMLMVISTVFGLLSFELLLPHQLRITSPLLLGYPSGGGGQGGLHVKTHHNSVVLPQVSLGGSVTCLPHARHFE